MRGLISSQIHIYFFQHSFHTVQQIIVPESDDPYARSLKNFRPLFVIQTLLIAIMPSAIKLNSNPRIMTVEVEDISTKWILPPELKTTETTSSQERPK